MTNAQDWLNTNIPLNQRINIRTLLICSASQREEHEFYIDGKLERFYEHITNHYYLEIPLMGTMDLSTFPNLEEIVVEGNYINSLILTGCSHLRVIQAGNNYLNSIIFPQQASELEDICLTNNNFPRQNLSCFMPFNQLRKLFLGTNNPDRINNNIYNRWCGSLLCLITLTKLQELDINATDINSGLEYLSTRELIFFTFGDKGRTEAGVNDLKAEIESYLELEEEETMEWWASNEEFEFNTGKVEDIRGWQEERQERIQLLAGLGIQREN